MAKEKKESSESENTYLGYQLVNGDKLERAINGNIGAEGQLQGGVGQDASEEAVIAEYDRLGGLILNKNGYKVKTGSFYNFDRKVKAPRKEPEVMLVFRDVNGHEVEVSEDEPLPVEVRAAQAAEAASKGNAKKGKKKADIEAEDEE